MTSCWLRCAAAPRSRSRSRTPASAPLSWMCRCSGSAWRSTRPSRPAVRMVASDDFAEFLRDQLAPLGRITMRRMFGKTGVFCDGVMLGMVTDNTLYLRVDDQNRATFKEAADSAPLNYRKKGETIDLAFWRAPDQLLD